MHQRFRSPNLFRLLGALAVLPLYACSTVGYYSHLARGEYAMLAARRPIARVIADPATDTALNTSREMFPAEAAVETRR